jgi:FtsH-binding integral membrane protein
MDLMKYSTYFMIGLIGLVVAMVINIFLQSSALEMLISIIGVIIFTALTAYDTQKIKRMAESYEVQSDSGLAIKVSVYGALELYLDFINLFLFLLRLFGGSRD